MATVYNKIENSDLTLTSLNNTMMVFTGNGWEHTDTNGIVVGRASGKSVAMSVLEEWTKEQDLEAKYPALAAAREQYNIIKAMCQENNNDPS